MDSADELISYIDRGGKNIYYYIINGVPRYDVFISNEGAFVNSDKRPIKKMVKNSSELLMMIHSKIEHEIDIGSPEQTKLF